MYKCIADSITCLQTSFNKDMTKTFLVYWNRNTVLHDPNMGCVVMWVLRRLELLEPQGKLKVDNFQAFLLAKGSGNV